VFGNTDLDARNFFDSKRAPFHQNMFGGTLGGPLYIPCPYNTDKNKTFFFISEGWNNRQGPQLVNFTSPPQSTFTATTLTAVERQGIFNTTITDPWPAARFPQQCNPCQPHRSQRDSSAESLLSPPEQHRKLELCHLTRQREQVAGRYSEARPANCLKPLAHVAICARRLA
jgi:hypothetical protein